MSAPDDKRECIGNAHKWSLALEEGHITLTTDPCGELCQFPHGGIEGDDMEWLAMPTMPVIVRWATDCPAYDTDDDGVPTGPVRPMGGYESGSHYIAHGTRCDCNWWPVVRPDDEEWAATERYAASLLAELAPLRDEVTP